MVGDIHGKTCGSSSRSRSGSGIGVVNKDPSLFGDLVGSAIGQSSGNVPLKKPLLLLLEVRIRDLIPWGWRVVVVRIIAVIPGVTVWEQPKWALVFLQTATRLGSLVGFGSKSSGSTTGKANKKKKKAMHRAMLLRKVAALPGPPMRCRHLHRVYQLHLLRPRGLIARNRVSMMMP